MTSTKITVEVTIDAPIKKVYDYWTKPVYIKKWNHASDDWHCPKATNDLKKGGRFCYTMASKDGKMSFDFEGVYIGIKDCEFIHYQIADGRNVEVSFIQMEDKVKVIETFEAEQVHSVELQFEGWQSILNNFKRLVEES